MPITAEEGVIPLGQPEVVPSAKLDAPTLDYASGPESNHYFSVGTLTYTGAGLVILFSLLLWGDFAWSMKDRSAGPIIQILVRHYHASNQEMQAFISGIPLAVGIFLGPIIGFMSDRHRGRWGRRIPFLLLSTPFAMGAMFGLGYSPGLGTSLHHSLGSHAPPLEVCIRLCFGMFWVLFEIATVTANAVFNGLINDVVPRKLLGTFYGFFRAFSLIAGMAFNFQLLGMAETHFKAIFIGIGLLYGIGFTFMCLTVKEGEYPPPSRMAFSEGHGALSATVTYFKECFSHPYYLGLILAMTFGSLTFYPVNNFTQPFAKSLAISNDTLGKYLAATYLISLLLSVFLGLLADWFHPLRIGIVAMALYATVCAWGEIYSSRARILFSVPYHFFGASGSVPVHFFAIALIAHGVLSGTYFTCTASLGQRLFPRARFAQFASAAVVISNLAGILLSWATGKFFDTYGDIYQHTYMMGGILALLGVGTMLIVHKGFVGFGGTKAYVAP